MSPFSGSVGGSPISWVKGQFLDSLGTSDQKVADCDRDANDSFALVYPTVEQMRNSKFGYSSGSSFPYTEITHLKQKWIKNIFHKWSPSQDIGRIDVMPHSKCFFRVNSDHKIKWILYGSHNLSKAGTFYLNN